MCIISSICFCSGEYRSIQVGLSFSFSSLTNAFHHSICLSFIDAHNCLCCSWLTGYLFLVGLIPHFRQIACLFLIQSPKATSLNPLVDPRDNFLPSEFSQLRPFGTCALYFLICVMASSFNLIWHDLKNTRASFGDLRVHDIHSVALFIYSLSFYLSACLTFAFMTRDRSRAYVLCQCQICPLSSTSTASGFYVLWDWVYMKWVDRCK